MNHLFVSSRQQKPGQQLAFLTAFLSLIFLLSQLPLSVVHSQGGAGTGPGGVGSTDGTSTLEVWYQSDETVYSDTSCTIPQTTDGGIVACWSDASGSGNNALSLVSGEEPTLQNGVGDPINGHSTLRWDGVNDILQTNTPVDLGAFTVFAVFNASGHGLVYEHNTQTNNNGGSYIYTNVGATHSVGRGVPMSITESWRDWTGDWGILGGTKIVGQVYGGTDATHNFFLNGIQQATSYGNNANPGVATLSANIHLGRRFSPSALPITGNYVEFMAYSTALNSAQRTLIENYLHAKYAVPIGNDYYTGDTGPNGDFDMDVVGIGQEADGDNLEAHSVGMIVTNGTFLDGSDDDGDYLIFGHRTAINDNVTTDLPVAWDGVYPNAQRWERHWEITVTDGNSDDGTVTIIFDFTEGGMDPTEPPIGPVSNYRLLGRSAPTGNFVDVVQATSISTSPPQVIFADVDVSDLNSNFTLATIDATVSPTAVEMQNAAALPLSLPPVIAGLAVLMLGGVTLVLLRRGRNA